MCIERGFLALFLVTQVVIVFYAVATGIFMCYPDAIGTACEDFTLEE